MVFTIFITGDIDRGDILALLPYIDTVDSLDLKGQYLMEVLEHAVSGWNASKPEELAKFLQFSGKVLFLSKRLCNGLCGAREVAAD